jgi:uncharacterized protein
MKLGHAIDFHVHVFPEKSHFQSLDPFRKKAKRWVKPFIGTFHEIQTALRYFPEFFRKGMDEIGGLVPLGGLLLESTAQDLNESMKKANIQYSLVIAHPPFIPNEFVMEICAQNPSFIPVVNIPKGAEKPAQILKDFIKKGAKALKIHPAADDEGPDSSRYKLLLKAAAESNLPVIMHSGCLHTHLLFKNPVRSRADLFRSWYKKYRDIPFILAHMNFHEPGIALDLCEEFPNLWVDTSWQPTEVIGEAVRRIGADRILFGTDWPLIGRNQEVGRKRIEEGIEIGLLNPEQGQRILRENAIKLLGLKVHAPGTR